MTAKKVIPGPVGLGDRVKDLISGIVGVVVGISEFLYGCRRLLLQPEEAKDGKPADVFSLDEPQAEILKKAVLAPTEVPPPKCDLGDRVKDKISKVSGIVVAVSKRLHTGYQIGIQPEKAKDGKPAHHFVVDDAQCEIVKKAIIVPTRAREARQAEAAGKPSPRNHGPRDDMIRQPEIAW